MKGRCSCLALLLCLFVATVGYAQNEDLMKQDSVKRDTIKLPAKQDTVKRKSIASSEDTLMADQTGPVQKIKSYADRFNPRKALLLAAILPGSGQIYTRKYWKVPLIWGGFGFLTYAVAYTQVQYTRFKDDLFLTINYPNQPTKTGYTQDQLRTLVDLARRQRDYYLIIDFFWYILQMVDAHVDAHLKEFDLNPNLQVRVEPRGGQDNMTGRTTGFALVFKFR